MITLACEPRGQHLCSKRVDLWSALTQGSLKLHANASITAHFIVQLCLRVKYGISKEPLYLLFSCILLSPLFHVIRGLGDALGLHSSDTSFPSVAMTRTGLGTNTGAEAAEDRQYSKWYNSNFTYLIIGRLLIVLCATCWTKSYNSHVLRLLNVQVMPFCQLNLTRISINMFWNLSTS